MTEQCTRCSTLELQISTELCTERLTVSQPRKTVDLVCVLSATVRSPRKPTTTKKKKIK